MHRTNAAPEQPNNAVTAAPFFLWRARTLAHAIIILLFFQAIAPLLGRYPLPAFLLCYMRPGMFVPWSIGLAGGLNADRISIITTGVLIVLTTWPDNMLPYAIASILGIILGASIRALIIQEKNDA